MAKCWTCGTPVSGWNYTCSSCKGLTELEVLREEIESYQGDIYSRLDHIADVQESGLSALVDACSKGLSEIASVIEWSFEEISWQLQQQTDVLRSIDQTLKTPSETQANEWRKMAEELRRRGVLDESEEFYLKALELNRLDYRIYVGLAETYLKINKFDKAKTLLERSLPHAPPKPQIDQFYKSIKIGGEEHFVHVKGVKRALTNDIFQVLEEADEKDIKWLSPEEYKALKTRLIDYRSYSYRLIGHIYACEEKYDQAAAALYSSIELSPGYALGHYDFAQYCALLAKKEQCTDSLQKAILLKPLYWYLTQKERNFDPVRGKVEELLSNIAKEASLKAKDSIAKSDIILKKAHESVSRVRQRQSSIVSGGVLNSICSSYDNAESNLKLARDKIASKDYKAFIDAVEICKESCTLASNAKNLADGEWGKIIEWDKRQSIELRWVRIFYWFVIVVLAFCFVVFFSSIFADHPRVLGLLFSGILLALHIIHLVGIYKRKLWSVPFTRVILIIIMFAFPIGTIIGINLWGIISENKEYFCSK